MLQKQKIKVLESKQWDINPKVVILIFIKMTLNQPVYGVTFVRL